MWAFVLFISLILIFIIQDLFGKSDPYFVISKYQENGTLLKVYESEVIKNTLNPVWRKVCIKESILNNGDDQRMLLFEGTNH